MDMTRHYLDHWRGYRLGGFPAQSWRIEGDQLVAIPEGPQIDLVSRRQYSNFEVWLEWWLPRSGNSGIMYRVSEEWEASWQTGPEMQLVGSCHPDARNPLTACGALYDLLPASETYMPPEDHFVSARLIVQDSNVEHWLAGRQLLTYNLAEPELRERVSQSKFQDDPEFGRLEKGHIVLQHHGTEARFRNIRIRALAD